MGKNYREKWERFLTPEILRPNLILAAIYITAFELLKNSIIERIQEFYETGTYGKDKTLTSEYKERVLSKKDSVIYASLEWLKDFDVINDEDINKFNKIKKTRNLLAHEMSKMLMEGLPFDYPDRYNDMVTLLNKIET